MLCVISRTALSLWIRVHLTISPSLSRASWGGIMSVIAGSLALTKYLPLLVSYPPEHLEQEPKPSGPQHPGTRTMAGTTAIQHNSTKSSDQFRILAWKLLFLLAQTFTLKICLLLNRLQEIGLVLTSRNSNHSCFLQAKGSKEGCRYLMHMDEPLWSHEY